MKIILVDHVTGRETDVTESFSFDDRITYRHPALPSPNAARLGPAAHEIMRMIFEYFDQQSPARAEQSDEP